MRCRKANSAASSGTNGCPDCGTDTSANPRATRLYMPRHVDLQEKHIQWLCTDTR